MRRVWRETVPVDDAWHDLPFTGHVVHVASRDPAYVEVWHEVLDDAVPSTRRFRVFGTGQDVPDRATHAGTAVIGPLVWHLYEERVVTPA